MSDELASNAIHGEGNLQVNERARNKISFAGTHRFGASRINDELEVVIWSQKVT
jgi:hypothetical protein